MLSKSNVFQLDIQCIIEGKIPSSRSEPMLSSFMVICLFAEFEKEVLQVIHKRVCLSLDKHIVNYFDASLSRSWQGKEFKDLKRFIRKFGDEYGDKLESEIESRGNLEQIRNTYNTVVLHRNEFAHKAEINTSQSQLEGFQNALFTILVSIDSTFA